MPTYAPTRTCPECGEPVGAVIVRHPDCYEQHQLQVYGFTERQWMLRHPHTTRPTDQQIDEEGTEK